MALGASQSLGRDDAEHLARCRPDPVAGPRRRAALRQRRRVRQTIIEMESGFLLTSAAAAYLPGRHRRAGRRLGLVAYEMAILVRRDGEHIRVNTRASALSGWG